MASAFTHAFAAAALGKTCFCTKLGWRFWILAIVSAILPDADVIGFAFGINYGDMVGHRGFSHSLPFALVWSFLVASIASQRLPRYSREWWKVLAFFFIVTASHGLLDALTNGGLGVAFFSPFDSARYFFPWRPISVSPVGVGRFFSAQGVAILASEIQYAWLPLATFWAVAGVLRRRLDRKSTHFP